jgi:hypothetical protein
MATMIKIQSKKNGLRNYYVDNHPICNIHFYRMFGITLSIGRGWIEHNNRDMDGLTLSSVRRATRLNLRKGGNFYIKSSSWQKDSVELYVDLDEQTDIKIGVAREKELYRTNTGITYHSLIELTAHFADAGYQNCWISVPGSARTEENPFGKKMNKIQEHISSLGASVTGLEICCWKHTNFQQKLEYEDETTPNQ